MSHAREMLDLAPTPMLLGAEEVAAAIDACADCEQSCSSCADLSLAEDDVATLSTCVALCVECADICGTTSRTLSRPVRADRLVVHRILQACVRSCELSAEECARHAAHHRHCAICEQVCRACEKACSELLEAEAFEELQKLAGG